MPRGMLSLPRFPLAYMLSWPTRSPGLHHDCRYLVMHEVEDSRLARSEQESFAILATLATMDGRSDDSAKAEPSNYAAPNL